MKSAPPGCDGLQCWPFFTSGNGFKISVMVDYGGRLRSRDFLQRAYWLCRATTCLRSLTAWNQRP